MSGELEHLKKEVAKLNEIVKRQSMLISRTGQNVLEMQVSKQKHDVSKFGSSKGGSKGYSDSDLATNEDLIQLVGELQGQLDNMEDRSIRRIINSTKTAPDDIVAPIPNADSDILDAKDGLYPSTVKEFEDLTDLKLFKIAKFYELIPPSAKEEEEFEKYLEGKVENFHINDIPDEELQKQLFNYKKDQLDDLFNDLARYLGLRSRRNNDTW
ncbi:hypothetical protein TPHA_0N01010 [Tetrapisispora phaffii CBS 4417]|uniref:Mrp8p n=1 Tax=Tetrapisispora phaffii (strain ATCC 24235 / CBS 4417 / NBRC 1672 / NRRL Y-8282 / UCD 70-5) TaxID=1071381 RepID=G8C154_TETPH|nr:hypothetical protein TPHA_0N01010 [Tetrapisispora phaffii CBS 4417]CCE65882.1 hypothetical protein TPHA_0N01010 [Tetrapisispora phaffii CBS 4417]